MKLTHYIHDKSLASRFIVSEDFNYGAHRLYIKQVQYHRDEYWINMLYCNGVSRDQIESYLVQMSDNTCDWNMNTKLRENIEK